MCSEIDFFTEFSPETHLENVNFVTFKPIASISDANKFVEFVVNGSPNQYISLKDSVLQVKVKVVRVDQDGTEHGVTDSNLGPISKVKPNGSGLYTDAEIKELSKGFVVPTNLLFHSMW